MKGKFYRSVVKPAMRYGAKCWAVKNVHICQLHGTKMRMMRLFSEVVSSNFTGKRLEGKATGFFKGIPSVSFTKDDISELASRFRLALVGKFKHRPSFSSMNLFLQKLGLKGRFEISALPHQRFLLNFSKEEDYLRLFLRRTWQVFGVPMTLTKWSPSLSQETENPAMPIWIAFPDLPIHLHDKRALHLISSTIGNPLQVDSCTLNFSRPALARCCVEVDISNLPPPKVLINHGGEELIFSFFYENVPSYCKDCKRTGHLRENCRGKKTTVADRKRPEPPMEEPVISQGQLSGQGNPEKWQAVKSKKGKNKVSEPLTGNFHWRAKPTATAHTTWLEGPGESSKNPVTSTAPNTPPSAKAGKIGTYCITDPNLLSSLTLRHVQENVLRTPIFSDIQQDMDNSLAIVPFQQNPFLTLPDDGPPEVGFFTEANVIDEKIKLLDNLLALENFPPLPVSKENLSGSPRSSSSRVKQISGFPVFMVNIAELIERVFGFLYVTFFLSKVPGSLGAISIQYPLLLSTKKLFVLNLAAWRISLAPSLTVSSFPLLFLEANSPSLEKGVKGESTEDLTEFWGRRHRLHISSLKDGNGKIHSSPEEISKITVEHYTKVFSFIHEGEMEEILNLIPSSVNDQDNYMLSHIPEEEEIKRTIWSLNANSTAGPDGFNGFFFRNSWDIIKSDVCKAVQEFFIGVPMPKVFGSTLITLIPKDEAAITLDQLRPISLSTFFSKIISRILSDRFKLILPKLISQEQTAFQTGKNITEHVLLTKEMVHLLSANARGGNCIIKLDLSKAFDKLSWAYLEGILTKFGFSRGTIHLLMGNLKATHFSVLVNGQPKGFFPMKCGVKQGDPLSPLLFIIALEGLSRFINHLHSTGQISHFSAGRTPTPSHLLYADDIILFTKADCRNLLRLKRMLSTFMNASGQEINYLKSQAIVHGKMKMEHQHKIRKILSIKCSTQAFVYLGSTIVKGKLKKIHCKDLIRKFERRINVWYSKKLNQMGRLILIKHVLSSIPMHLMAAQRLPKSITKSLKRLMANFLWGEKEESPKYHWRKWDKLCYPFVEGGAGFEELHTLPRRRFH
ncbi:unnamed protein product [Cuscuta campestris]|uniref:Reverse transcriptase domain-containing protein n=1 Tax=Cuscuta campestris TaxID=132261 RepID=A0A484KM95_9ASTE|nr:unnamed protein product [Cuscuta campestris]